MPTSGAHSTIPHVVHGMVEDYRAGCGVDREHDAADRADGRRITCPLLVVSLLRDDPDLDDGASLLEIWQAWATTSARTRSTAATTSPRRNRTSSRCSSSTSSERSRAYPGSQPSR